MAYQVEGLSEYKRLVINGFSILLTHGHQVAPWGDLDALSKLQREYDADIVISGHTHIPSCRELDGSLFLNPGSGSGAYSTTEMQHNKRHNAILHST